MSAAPHLVHGTCVALAGRGVLLRGPSGSGKSDVALRLIDAGAILVADDQVRLDRTAAGLIASAPPALSGLIEARGIGILRLPALERATLALVIDLVSRDAVPRLPEDPWTRVHDTALPVFRLHAFDASTPVKIARALAASPGPGAP